MKITLTGQSMIRVDILKILDHIGVDSRAPRITRHAGHLNLILSL